MQNSIRTNSARIGFTVAALLLEMAHLGLEYLNGGVPAHHLLNRADLPAISNWWGLVVIPALAWFLIGRVQRRIEKQNAYQAGAPRIPAAVLIGFMASLAYGAALSFAFISNFEAISYVFLAAFAVSLLAPTYRAECILGFVLGMMFTFGAVLPTLIAAVIASFSRIAHLVFGFAVRLIRGNARPHPL